jgi:aspartyl-tRNA(Asn)/glutamyl-tRNA(Gln) amidotransferase subunit A
LKRTTTNPGGSRELVEEALLRATAPDGEGRRVFTRLAPERALRAAEAVDARRAAGEDLSPVAGLPVSVKDLFDVQGEVTTAGSVALAARPPAVADAMVITRLKRAGAVIVGRTNMTEFAYSGVGINPHYGTPANPWERARRRIPGGSSSGAAVSVTDGMAVAAIGTDTGGSARIPAALCGLVGFKPTQSRIPLDGVFPLSSTLDTVGVIARTVACCAAFDAVLADQPHGQLPAADLHAVKFAVPTNYFLDGMDRHVARAFENALAVLSRAGAMLTEVALPQIAEVQAVNARGGFAAAQSWGFHRRLGTDLDAYDPFVRERIQRGETIDAAECADMARARGAIIRRFDAAHGDFDAIVCPTVPVVAPEIARLEQDAEEYRRVNLLLLRNPSVANFLDRCAVSIPCHKASEAPVGLMLMGRRLEDSALLSMGLGVERELQQDSGM